jgi:hypothetical protein
MSRGDRRPSRIVLARSAMLGALAVGVVALAVASTHDDDTIDTAVPVSPVATVRQFLNTASVERDAEGACDFLTPSERTRVGGARGCEDAMTRLARRLRPPVHPIGLRGSDVAVLGRGDPVVLHLEPLARSPRPEAVAPESGWRIASGVERFRR